MADINDAIKQLQAGSTRAPADLTSIALAPACTLEQCQLIISAFYDVLDDVHLQASKTDKSLPQQQVASLSSIATIIVKRYACPDIPSSFETLAHHWPALHQWILYLKRDFVDQDSVDTEFRLQARKAIADFLGICDDTLLGDTFDTIISSPDIIVILFSLWRLEIRDKRFSVSGDSDPSYHPIFQTPATLDSWMCAFSHRETWHWSEFLRAFDGDTGALAATALEHLRQDIACEPTNYDLIIWDIHLMTTLSINDSIRIPFLTQQSMVAMSNVVNSLVDRHATTDADQYFLVAKCISYGYWYIRAYAESTEGLPWIIQIVEAGLLPTLLSTEAWIEHLGGQDHEDWEPLFLLLGQIIPKYSVYNSALKHMIKQLAAIDASGLPGKLDKSGLLFQCWTVFETIVRNRAVLYGSALDNETHIESCQNEKCDKSGPLGSFKSCAGCLHVHYCSKECQVYDWKSGGHQKYCRDIQARRAEGLISRLSKRDVRFLDRVISQDLTLFRDRIQHAAATTSNLDPVVVELDYTEIPMQVDIGSVQTVPAIQTCPCDMPVAQKWNHMVELAQKSASKRILVRAFLPGGTSERMKLRCLPLKRILGDCAPSVDEEGTSEFDDTFDLLYSRAGQSFGVVDAAFPNEAIRALREKTITDGEKSDAAQT